MAMYGIHMQLDFFNITINDVLENMTIIININTHTQKKKKKTYCMCIQSSFTFGVYIF
jgi:pimeloyl-CoA synthetase